jgi:hypothetical protein
MARQFITFGPNVNPVNEQKVEIFILLLNREFSDGTAAYQQTNADQIHIGRVIAQCKILPTAISYSVGFDSYKYKSATIVLKYYFTACWI